MPQKMQLFRNGRNIDCKMLFLFFFLTNICDDCSPRSHFYWFVVFFSLSRLFLLRVCVTRTTQFRHIYFLVDYLTIHQIESETIVAPILRAVECNRICPFVICRVAFCLYEFRQIRRITVKQMSSLK